MLYENQYPVSNTLIIKFYMMLVSLEKSNFLLTLFRNA